MLKTIKNTLLTTIVFISAPEDTAKVKYSDHFTLYSTDISFAPDAHKMRGSSFGCIVFQSGCTHDKTNSPQLGMIQINNPALALGMAAIVANISKPDVREAFRNLLKLIDTSSSTITEAHTVNNEVPHVN